MSIPMRPFGRAAGVTVSALGFGGHHLGDVESEAAAVALVHEAVDRGVTFFDNCWEYHNGRSEQWMGKALRGRRDRVFLMSKVCTHGRGAALATEMLEQSLRRLGTDHLDLWQIHGVVFDNEPDLARAAGGMFEALERAKRDGKVRFVGFSGHKDPRIHLAMLATGFAFDACQMPLNAFDASFRSFEGEVLPECARRGVAALGMKSLGGKGDPVKKGAVTAEEALRYAMSLPVATTISGMESVERLRQNLAVANDFRPMAASEMDALRRRVAPYAGDGRFELYKVSLKYDNPEARLAHGFPIDPLQGEIREQFEAVMPKP